MLLLRFVLTSLILLTLPAASIPGPLSWTAGRNSRFAGLTSEQLKKFLGAKKPKNVDVSPSFQTVGTTLTLPDHFDAREAWKNCSEIIGTVRDQSACGACWATSSAAVMSDMTCIICNGEYSPYISDEDLLSCCTECGNCEDGGHISDAFAYWNRNGIVTGGLYGSGRGCRPYTIPPAQYLHGKDPPTPACVRECQTGYPLNYTDDLRKGSEEGWIAGATAMQAQIFQSGPIVTTFQVYESFMKSYQSGVYQCPNSGDTLIGWHGVKIIGWGTENGVPYWLAVNSWGTSWGDSGFFKIQRGKNDCQFESSAYYGIASSAACFNTASNFTASGAQKSVNGSLGYFLLVVIVTSRCW